MQNKRKEQGSEIGRLAAGVLWGCFSAFLCIMGLLLIFSFGVSNNIFGEKIIYAGAFLSSLIGCFVGSFVGVSKYRKRIIPLSLWMGATIFILQIIIGFICFNESFSSNKLALFLGSDLVGAIGAGVVYSKRGNRKRITR